MHVEKEFMEVDYNMHVEKKFMEVDYNMSIQNHVYYKNVVQQNHLLGWWCNG
jgi:hypothetical protein